MPTNEVIKSDVLEYAGERTSTSASPRPLHAIARDIEKHWPNVSHYAKPYHEAMKRLNKITDSFYADSARSVVLYFLSNANSWKGEDARRIKAELREMVK